MFADGQYANQHVEGIDGIVADGTVPPGEGVDTEDAPGKVVVSEAPPKKQAPSAVVKVGLSEAERA